MLRLQVPGMSILLLNEAVLLERRLENEQYNTLLAKIPGQLAGKITVARIEQELQIAPEESRPPHDYIRAYLKQAKQE
jgi:hypothetical protein